MRSRHILYADSGLSVLVDDLKTVCFDLHIDSLTEQQREARGVAFACEHARFELICSRDCCWNRIKSLLPRPPHHYLPVIAPSAVSGLSGV